MFIQLNNLSDCKMRLATAVTAIKAAWRTDTLKCKAANSLTPNLRRKKNPITAAKLKLKVNVMT